MAGLIFTDPACCVDPNRAVARPVVLFDHLTMNVINAVAQFERDLLIERTQSSLSRAKANGQPLGRPSALSADQQAEVKDKIKDGETISAIARHFETSRQTIMRVRNQG